VDVLRDRGFRAVEYGGGEVNEGKVKAPCRGKTTMSLTKEKHDEGAGNREMEVF